MVCTGYVYKALAHGIDAWSCVSSEHACLSPLRIISAASLLAVCIDVCTALAIDNVRNMSAQTLHELEQVQEWVLLSAA